MLLTGLLAASANAQRPTDRQSALLRPPMGWRSW